MSMGSDPAAAALARGRSTRIAFFECVSARPVSPGLLTRVFVHKKMPLESSWQVASCKTKSPAHQNKIIVSSISQSDIEKREREREGEGEGERKKGEGGREGGEELTMVFPGDKLRLTQELPLGTLMT